jgi:hypothetical protein
VRPVADRDRRLALIHPTTTTASIATIPCDARTLTTVVEHTAKQHIISQIDECR